MMFHLLTEIGVGPASAVEKLGSLGGRQLSGGFDETLDLVGARGGAHGTGTG
jgi:hypothetical protein